jgi:hypothetical protein
LASNFRPCGRLPQFVSLEVKADPTLKDLATMISRLTDIGLHLARATVSQLQKMSIFRALPAERLAQLQHICLDLIKDVPPGQKHGLACRISHVQRRRDLWFMRGSLFSAISIQHGDQIARQRIRQLDKQLRNDLH